MRAILVEEFCEPEGLVIKDIADPLPGPDDVLVEVHAAGVNYPDLLTVAGTYQSLPPLPFTPGKEGAGIVRSVGANVKQFRPADRVSFELGSGAFAELVAVRAHHCFPVPDTVPLSVAAAMGVTYQTAHFALTVDGNFKPGEWVMVNGASGGVGIAAVQIAKALGGNVIGVTGSPSKIDFISENGADAIIDVSSDDKIKSLREQVARITGDRGVDIIIDPVGGALLDAGMRTLRPHGRAIIIGFTSGETSTFKSNYLLIKGISVIGSNRGFYIDTQLDRIFATQVEILDMVGDGRIKSPVTVVLPLESAAEALTLMKNRGVSGKIVLTTKFCLDAANES